jgi:hypothetical protein
MLVDDTENIAIFFLKVALFSCKEKFTVFQKLLERMMREEI